ncbi:hypothetical protein AB9T89_20960 [Flavobacterium oncorhynchi]|uniref:hypothetical protein n=1 Tax=Flavobacterium oncorhynchi TaxID=728056 RepID=UPI00351A7C0F
MMKKKVLLKILCVGSIMVSTFTKAQTGIGTVNPASSSILDLTSSNKAFLLPRVASSAVIAVPVSGMMIYDLSANCVKVYRSGAWFAIAEMAVGFPSATPILCVNTPLATIVHNTVNVTGIGIPTGLPGGVTASWAGNKISISGAPQAVGSFSYSIPLVGGGGPVNATGTITVIGMMVSVASSTPSICINTPLTAVTHSTINATGIGTPTGLPAGVSASWSGNTISINGTPTAAGTFSYSIPLVGGDCDANATGTITVKPVMTVGPASQTPSICINTPLAAVTHSTTNATGIGTPTGLPAGVTAAWSSNTISISGTPTQSGTFSYNIPVVGNGCGIVNATGTITVKPVMTVGPASQTPSVCINTPLAAVTHSTTNATGIGTPAGLPAGVTAAWSSNIISISGTPTQSGTFSYNIPLVGNGCGIVNATGTITVKPAITVSSGSGNNSALVYSSLVITHSTSDVIMSRGTPSGLPPGVTASWSGTTLTIAGTPSTSGAYDYSIPLTGNCGTVNAIGTIIVSNCGANVAPGVFKAFQCYNVGAYDAFPREATVASTAGFYYQWGSANATATYNTDPNYVNMSGVRMADQTWKEVVHAASDPCGYGYRVPNNVDWQGVITYNAITRIGAWYADNSNYTSFIRFGNSLSLPAAGFYSPGYNTLDGNLSYRGLIGRYWTSSSSGDYAYHLFFDQNSQGIYYSDKIRALSVRCISL